MCYILKFVVMNKYKIIHFILNF